LLEARDQRTRIAAAAVAFDKLDAIKATCAQIVNCVAPASDGGYDSGAILLAEDILDLINAKENNDATE